MELKNSLYFARMDFVVESKNCIPKLVNMYVGKKSICISALIDEEVIGVFIASPDIDNGQTERLEFEFVEDTRGRYIKFIVPKLEIWNLIYIKVSDPKE